jgi:hypothetical protein
MGDCASRRFSRRKSFGNPKDSGSGADHPRNRTAGKWWISPFAAVDDSAGDRSALLSHPARKPSRNRWPARTHSHASREAHGSARDFSSPSKASLRVPRGSPDLLRWSRTSRDRGDPLAGSRTRLAFSRHSAVPEHLRQRDKQRWPPPAFPQPPWLRSARPARFAPAPSPAASRVFRCAPSPPARRPPPRASLPSSRNDTPATWSPSPRRPEARRRTRRATRGGEIFRRPRPSSDPISPPRRRPRSTAPPPRVSRRRERVG